MIKGSAFLPKKIDAGIVIAILAILGGALFGFSWLLPGETTGAIIGWIAVLLLVYISLESKNQLFDLYLAGIASQCIGFYWLFHTISKFGGFNLFFSFLIFSLYVLISALQFPISGFITRLINNDTKSLALTCAFSWASIEFLWFRIFPWCFGHTQLGILPFAQIADIGGVALITIILFWVSEVFVRYFFKHEKSIHFFLPIVLLLGSISYGRYRIEQFSEPEGEKQKIAVIQANVSIEDKHSGALIETNVKRYADLSKVIPGPDTLIVWPESVIIDFINDYVGSVGNDPRLPFFENQNPMLFGALSYSSPTKIYNSAFAILNSGTVLDPYHKQILMPFGEFMPMADTFPFLRSLNPNIANFSSGTDVKVFEYPMFKDESVPYSLRVSPLICYEDVLPVLSREAVNRGAELLVNLTNDGWFGDSVAPYQHNLIASFRAIENRRFLVRSTNTGLTTIVDPAGRTIQELPPFSEGTLLADITLMSYITMYTKFIGDGFSWLIIAFTLTFAVYHFAFRKP